MVNFLRNLPVLSATAVLLAISSVPAHASATLAITGATGGTLFTSGDDQVYGIRFSVGAAINVLSLGVFDTNNDGLAISHDVGLYRISDQALLASTTVPAGTGATLIGGFRFVDLSSAVALAPDNYELVMTMPDHNADTQAGDASSVSTNSPITYIGSGFDESAVLHFPNPVFDNLFNEGFVGPNMTFETSAVPEPSTWLFLAGGCAAFAFLRFRRVTTN